MLNFKLGDQPFSLPVSWREVTVGQFKQIINQKRPGDLTEIISILSGLDYDLLNTSVRSLQENAMLVEAVAWAAKLPDWFNLPMPKTFEVDGKAIDLKKDINKLPFGQYASFISLAAINPMVWKEKNYCNVNTVDKAIAIYCYPDWAGLEWSDKWEDMLPSINRMPFLECFSVATFFLNRFKDSHESAKGNYTTLPRKTKSSRASHRSKNLES